MKKTTLVFGFLVVSAASYSQKNNPVDSILTEGRLLYRLEMASWNATDIILRDQPRHRTSIGGFFSYESNNQLHSIFYSRHDTPHVIASVVFDTSINTSTAKTYTFERGFTHHEQRLYNIKRQSSATVYSDTLFSIYEHTRFNLIPVADSTCGKVFVFTEPELNGVVIFGNDYLLTFDKKDSLLQKRALHSTIIPVDFGKDTDPELIETFHLHTAESGSYITPTDICTLLLYHQFARWKQHLVLSKSHVCAWDLENNELQVLTAEQWNRANPNKKPVGVNF